MQLYLIPPDGGQGERVPPRRRPCLSLTPVQRKRLRAALRNLRKAYGSWSCLAEVMGMAVDSLKGIAYGRDSGSPGTAQRAAKAAGVTVEQLLGGLTAADRCPTCGRSG
ncbi:helix-turn-helix domain-containing protein [Sorangium sp. So ce1153]|uniref:helix-turn-helix domain-containing protein n=1 Tax=Sorangium sp. So ce1153 TaxID=3133333 RepID=UPI003F5F782D